MQHLDEGTLQAWLDGSRSGLDPDERTAIEQHVGACDECAARVDALRSSTERAMSLLGTRAAEGPPPFAAVQARAERAAAAEAGEPGRRPVREFRWRSMTWAASVAVALGAGWLANDFVRRPGGGGGAFAGDEAVRVEAAEAVAEAEEAAAGDEPMVLGDAMPATGARAEREVAEAAGDPAQGAAPVEQAAAGLTASIEIPALPEAAAAAPDIVADATTPQAAARSEAADRAVAPAPPATEPRAAEMERRDETARQAAEAARRRPEGPTPESTGVDQQFVRGRVVDASSGRPLESAQVFVPSLGGGALTNSDGRFALAFDDSLVDSVGELELRVRIIGYGETAQPFVLARGDTVLPDVRLESTALRLQQLVVTGVAGDPPPSSTSVSAALRVEETEAWLAMDREDAATVAGFALLSVPDLAVVLVETTTIDGASVVRVTQALEDGGSLTLIQASRPIALPDAEGRAVSERQVGDVWVAGLAPVSVEELVGLLGRVR